MNDPLRGFGGTAKSLSRNPLGIIALFIVLVYGLASIVITQGDNLSEADRLPLVYFLVIYPVLVLSVFGWLVSKHSGKLFAPSDFRDEENYVKMQLSAVASLAIASAKDPLSPIKPDVSELVATVRTASGRSHRNSDSERPNANILWVDDRPQNNLYERRAFEAIGLSITLALSTNEALQSVASKKYAAIISDMGRKEGPREGYVLLDQLRERGDVTPVFFYASSNSLEHKRETREHGGQGCTNDPQELFQMVTKCVIGGG